MVEKILSFTTKAKWRNVSSCWFLCFIFLSFELVWTISFNSVLSFSLFFFADLQENGYWFRSVASTSSSNIQWTLGCCSLLCLPHFIWKCLCALTETETFQEESPNAASMRYSFQQQEQGNLASLYRKTHRALVAMRELLRGILFL